MVTVISVALQSTLGWSQVLLTICWYRHFPCHDGAVYLTCGYALHQEKEKLYVELKHILARQPGPEAAEQLQIYRHTLREKTKQLKVSGNFCFFLAGGQPHTRELDESTASVQGASLPNATCHRGWL